MTHHISLINLIQDFSSKQETGIVRTERLAMLTAVSIAYAAPLPNNGTHGSGEAFSTVAYKVVSAFVSDVNERVFFDHDRVTMLARALYIQRYEACYCPQLALEAMSPLETLQSVFDGDANATGADAKATLSLWGARFVEVAQIYIKDFNKG